MQQKRQNGKFKAYKLNIPFANATIQSKTWNRKFKGISIQMLNATCYSMRLTRTCFNTSSTNYKIHQGGTFEDITSYDIKLNWYEDCKKHRKKTLNGETSLRGDDNI